MGLITCLVMSELIHGDAFEEMDSMEDGTIDLLLTSPPYNTNFSYEEYDDGRPFTDWYKEMVQVLLSESKRLVCPGGYMAFVTGFSSKYSPDISNSLRPLHTYYQDYALSDALGLELVNEIILVEESKGDASHPFLEDPNTEMDHHTISIFRNPSQNQDKERQPTNLYGSVWGMDGWPDGRDTPLNAVYPYEVAKRLVGMYSGDGDTVLDPFIGSGTTALACETFHRDWIGVEMDESYVEYAEEAIEKHSSRDY